MLPSVESRDVVAKKRRGGADRGALEPSRAGVGVMEGPNAA